MADKSNIEWTDATWNALYGCSRVSPGCVNCYAERHIHRFAGPGQRHEGLTVIRGGRPGWTGKIQLAPHRLDQPLRWQRPRRVFVNSLSDLFHENVPFEYIAATYGVMSAARQHTFQVLTKRPERAAEFFKWLREYANKRFGIVIGDENETMLTDVCLAAAVDHGVETKFWMGRDGMALPGYWDGIEWPLKNVWLGVSAENQETYNARVPKLVHKCEASVKWVSAEPLLGPIDLRGTGRIHLQWLVVGGESGPGARPMDSAWVESLRMQCEEAEIPFHFKQWGLMSNNPDGDDPTAKKNGGGVKGGRMLNGRTWDDEPASLMAHP